MAQTIYVRGVGDLQRALKNIADDVVKEIDRELREITKIVADDARQRFSAIDQRSAQGFRPRLRGFGRAFVEQRKRKTTGYHPEYGGLQMRRALLPALGSKQDEVEEKLEDMLDMLGLRNGF